MLRDGSACVLCGSTDLDPPHHAYFGLEANRWPNRNHESQLVCICKTCHHRLHFQGWTEERERCKRYLENLPN